MSKMWTDFKRIDRADQLYERAMKNFDRLESEPYDLDHVFQTSEYAWPGDWEGRTILALTLLAQATGREPRYLDEIMNRLEGYLNERGYYGRILPAGTFDEQQLSGNSWLLRAVVEHYSWKRDARSERIVHNIVRQLLLPARGYYRTYPVLPEQRVYQGEAMGSLQEQKVGDWYLSTDIGCAFIMLDGATHAYEMLRWPELKELLDEMIEVFLGIDVLGLSFQTHATLSALRGLLRYYEMTGDGTILEKAEELFEIYLGDGMTENYANYNWFGRPDWTEPCAVVDSFISAAGLWKNTGKSLYLEAAHCILYNGLGYGQRPNGGFGCDTCVGARDPWISPKSAELFEAFWCCTMRGGEGLSQAIRYGYVQDESGIDIPFYATGSARLELPQGKLVLRQQSDYPVEGLIRITVEESVLSEPVSIRLYIPSWTSKEDLSIRVDGVERTAPIVSGFASIEGIFKAGTVIELQFSINLRESLTVGRHSIRGVRSFWHGALLLGADNPADSAAAVGFEDGDIRFLGGASYRLGADGPVLSPICDLFYKSMPEALNDKKLILFPEGRTAS